MKTLLTVLAIFVSVSIMAQDMERFEYLKGEVLNGRTELAEKALSIVPGDTAILYALAKDALYEGNRRRNMKLMQRCDSLISVIIDGGGVFAKYYNMRGLAGQQIADAAFIESNWELRNETTIGLYEKAIADLQHALDNGLSGTVYGVREQAEKKIGEMQKKVNEIKYE